LVEAYPYLILDALRTGARERRDRQPGVPIVIGIDWNGRRPVMAVELANRESRSSLRDFLSGLQARSLQGVEFVVRRRSRGAQNCTARGFGGSRLLALLCAFLRKRARLTNMLERLDEEIKRHSHIVRTFANGESCLRLVRALAVEPMRTGLEQHRYLNADDPREHKTGALRRAACGQL